MFWLPLFGLCFQLCLQCFVGCVFQPTFPIAVAQAPASSVVMKREASCTEASEAKRAKWDEWESWNDEGQGWLFLVVFDRDTKPTQPSVVWQMFFSGVFVWAAVVHSCANLVGSNSTSWRYSGRCGQNFGSAFCTTTKRTNACHLDIEELSKPFLCVCGPDGEQPCPPTLCGISEVTMLKPTHLLKVDHSWSHHLNKCGSSSMVMVGCWRRRQGANLEWLHQKFLFIIKVCKDFMYRCSNQIDLDTCTICWTAGGKSRRYCQTMEEWLGSQDWTMPAGLDQHWAPKMQTDALCIQQKHKDAGDYESHQGQGRATWMACLVWPRPYTMISSHGVKEKRSSMIESFGLCETMRLWAQPFTTERSTRYISI